MVNPKRGGSFGHYDNQNVQPNKKYKTESSRYNTANHNGYNSSHSRKYPHRQNEFSNQPQEPYSDQPDLTSSHMTTGLGVLLDRFVADEMTPSGDADVLYHARELRRLLSSKNGPKVSDTKAKLDEKRPDKVSKVVIPDYIERRVRAAADFPPLPPIAEPHLRDAVFTHRSAHVNPADPRCAYNFNKDLDYERLELLGDAYIELIATRALYNRFPEVDVPELCSWRERLVENTTLSKFSRAYDFPTQLQSKTHWDPGSKAWTKVTADIFEAYIAGLVLADPENGFNIAEEWLTCLWAPQLLGFKEKIIENPHARNELNKLVLTKDVRLDCREEKPMTYDSNKLQQYYIGVYLTGWGYTNEKLGSGEGQSKAQAAVAAANNAITRNCPALQDAVQKKAKMMETKREEAKKERKEKPEELALENEGEDEESISEGVYEEAEHDHNGVKGNAIDEANSKKRKSEGQESPVEKKKKKEKREKEKKEKKKKHKAYRDHDDDSS